MKKLSESELALWFVTWPSRRKCALDLVSKPKDILAGIDETIDVDYKRDEKFIEQFVEFVRHENRMCHPEDIDATSRKLFTDHSTFLDWYDCILEKSGFELKIFASRPVIGLLGLPQWRHATAHCDPDALICLYAAKRLTDSPFGQESIVEQLKGWKTLIRAEDPDLDDVLRDGCSDTHIHLEAADPIPVAWLRLMAGWVRVEDFKRYNSDEIIELANDNFAAIDREREKLAISEALEIRSSLLRHCGIAEVANRDWVEDELSSEAYLAEEREFLFAAWRILLIGDRKLASGLSRYLYGKNLFLYRHQQFPGSGIGLNVFRDYLDRGETIIENRLKKSSKRAQENRIFRLSSCAFEPEVIKHIEFRIAPQKTKKKYYQFFDLWEKRVLPRLKLDEKDRSAAFVVHFIRNNMYGGGRKLDEGVPFEKVRKDLDKQTVELHMFRREQPVLSRNIVGIDVANIERGCPPEIFSPFLKLLRGEVSLADNRREWGQAHVPKFWRRLKEEFRGNLHRHPYGLPRLGLTYHAGEDFYHLTDGLRQIDMLSNHLLSEGDRIGHGLALGIDPNDFQSGFSRNRQAPAGVLLSNFIWLLRMGDENGLLSSALRHTLKNAVFRLAERAYGTDLRLDALNSLQSIRFDFLPDQNAEPTTLAGKLYWRETYKKTVRETLNSASDPSDFAILNECSELLRSVQELVIRKLQRKGITVEVNPSSNTATGAVDEMVNHPLFNIVETLDSGAGISVNTDDPGVFSTRLDNEFGMVFGAMLVRFDGDRPRARRYLQQMRDAGNYSRFMKDPIS
ncbi:hypothetical protein [Thalassospira lucentensis]|uniref:hypothetical protein n=1 Tax=Thalassospira lucentensis TaxID=168935 RepID=UPI0003B71DFE|nr:hypothetical protein [Thalassospira lucentensis]RCK29398.1 hypothetical protein TH1_05505 [Thalassospira lucentensis MCCC 1A00383 = DSM 14000]